MYHILLQFPILKLFNHISINILGQFSVPPASNRHLLVVLRHPIESPAKILTLSATTDMRIEFMKYNTLNDFSSPEIVISDNATRFTASGLEEKIKLLGS